MTRRQRVPDQWLISDDRIAAQWLALVRRLPPRSGIIVRQPCDRLTPRLRLIARQRRLILVEEACSRVARVHNAKEVRRARLAGAGLLLLSPMFPTSTHPGLAALPRMRAAALARLAGRPLLALGGMNARRYARVRGLGLDGWAGIDAWLRT